LSAAGPLQRVTLWVSDAEASLALYRDLLGLPVLEDKLVPGPYLGRMVGYDAAALRIVHLGSGASGWVGLYELRDASPAPVRAPTADRRRLSPGQATVVLQARGVEALAATIAAAGYEFLLRPQVYVKETGTPVSPAGRYTETIFYDADGIPVSLIEHVPA
jgi:catechol 2,3-dioxygenase-like lactoylglutathione lyase family enzyme